jgi:hypothetical protein
VTNRSDSLCKSYVFTQRALFKQEDTKYIRIKVEQLRMEEAAMQDDAVANAMDDETQVIKAEPP